MNTRQTALLLSCFVFSLPLYGASLAKRLASPDPTVRVPAVQEFEQLPADARERFAPDLMVAMNDEDPGVRNQAAQLLKEMRISKKDLPNSAGRQLQRATPPPRSENAETFRKIRKDKREAFPDLKKELDKEKGDGLSAQDLKNEQHGFNSTAPLLESLKDPDPWVRSRSARRLSFVHPSPLEAIPTLINLLKDPDTEVRASAAGALGAMGPAAHEALPALLHTLGDSDKGVRQIASDSLKQIQSSNP